MSPSRSKAQQRFFGMVRAKQKGELKDGSPAITKAAKNMKKKDVKDFASTKHKGLPKKVKKEKEKIEEAFGEKLDLYVQIIYRWLESQGYSESEIDAIFEDPDSIDIIQNAEYNGGHPIEDAAKKLIASDVGEPEEVSMPESLDNNYSYVNESLDNFVNEINIRSKDPEEVEIFIDTLLTALMERGLTSEEADFTLGQIEEYSLEKWAHQYRSDPEEINDIADGIVKYVFRK